MTTFLQLHFLTPYPPSNPNRDDMGRPKTAFVGGAPRLRLSSQSIKRAVRKSSYFEQGLRGHMGKRTKRIGEFVLPYLKSKGVSEKEAFVIAEKLIEVFGKLDKGKKEKKGVLEIAQLAFVSPEERREILNWADRAMSGEKLPDVKKVREDVLRFADGAADIAMFGRMLANSPEYNREAAVQVSHAITTHRAQPEDDYFTAVDDLKDPSEDSGAGHLGDSSFGSGLYYLYSCVNCDLLVRNLDDEMDLAKSTCKALVAALATATPSGKQASYAHRPRAVYIRAEVGSNQPRDLSGAFFEPVTKMPWIETSILEIERLAKNLDTTYGPMIDEVSHLNVFTGEGSLDAIQTFAENAVARVNSND